MADNSAMNKVAPGKALSKRLFRFEVTLVSKYDTKTTKRFSLPLKKAKQLSSFRESLIKKFPQYKDRNFEVSYKSDLSGEIILVEDDEDLNELVSCAKDKNVLIVHLCAKEIEKGEYLGNPTLAWQLATRARWKRLCENSVS